MTTGSPSGTSLRIEAMSWHNNTIVLCSLATAGDKAASHILYSSILLSKQTWTLGWGRGHFVFLWLWLCRGKKESLQFPFLEAWNDWEWTGMCPAGPAKEEGLWDETISKFTGSVDSRSLGFVNGLKHRRLAPGKSPSADWQRGNHKQCCNACPLTPGSPWFWYSSALCSSRQSCCSSPAPVRPQPQRSRWR